MEANKIELVEPFLFVATKVSLKATEVLTLIMFVVSKKISGKVCGTTAVWPGCHRSLHTNNFDFHESQNYLCWFCFIRATVFSCVCKETVIVDMHGLPVKSQSKERPTLKCTSIITESVATWHLWPDTFCETQII